LQTSENGISFIQANEGFVPTVYNDNGHPAIGYGHDLLPGESFPQAIDQAEGVALLQHDIAPLEAYLNQAETTLNQNQFDALIDFGYNLGLAALHMLLSHGLSEVPDQVPRWNHVNGLPNAALSARRAAEVSLFNS
jgi:lysozyme